MGDPLSAPDVWFVLHGYGQLAERFIEGFAGLPGLDSGGRSVVAPEALSRFYLEAVGGEHGPGSKVGATWMTRADRDHEILDYVEYLDRVALEVLAPGGRGTAPAGPITGGARRIVVLGFSQGTATASRWVTSGRIAPDEVILWGGGLASDLDLSAAHGALDAVSLRLVTGDGDDWGRARASETVTRLESIGIEPTVIEFKGGHEIRPELLSVHWPV
jgi:hypothetical protein